jgi:hypothetical protein
MSGDLPEAALSLKTHERRFRRAAKPGRIIADPWDNIFELLELARDFEDRVPLIFPEAI